MSRSHSIVQGLDHSWMVGVEIGPWYSPIASRASGWNTVVVDFCSGGELREKARTHSSSAIRACEDKIEDVDVIWRGQALDKALLAIHPGGYDFLIASHVMEHIPDLIGFLKELRNVIKAEGIISLAMPDMRFCFDFFKPLTMTDSVLLAHREQRVRHSPETLFSANAYQSWLDGNGAWYRSDSPDVDLICPLQEAFSVYLKEVAHPRSGEEYVDAHAWIFAPALSFGHFGTECLGLDRLQSKAD